MQYNGADLSGDQIDDALYRLQHLMQDEQDDEDDILNSIKVLAEQVSHIEQARPSTVKVSHNDFTNMVQVMYNKHQTAQQKIEAIRMQQHHNSHQPNLMSGESKKIIQRKIASGHYQPIHQRAEQIQLDKRIKYEEAQKQKSLDLQFKEQYTHQPKVPSQDPRSVDQFLLEVDYFIKKRNLYIEVGQRQQLNRELEGVTFKPQVNPNSERIVSQSKELNSTVQDRLQRSHLLKQLKSKKMVEDEFRGLTFKPQLNTNSMKIANESMQVVPRFERLHHGYTQVRKIQHKCNTSQVLNTSVNSSMVLGVNKNIQNTSPKQPTTILPHTPTKQRCKTPPPPNYNEIKYQPNMQFIVDLVGKRRAN